MLALLCFCVATIFLVNKDLYKQLATVMVATVRIVACYWLRPTGAKIRRLLFFK